MHGGLMSDMHFSGMLINDIFSRSVASRAVPAAKLKLVQVQPELGEAISFALKPNRVLVLESGDSLNLIAERYGTTVQTLRAVNSDLAQQGPITTAAGRGSVFSPFQRAWC